jgi:hypothetical protein
MNYILQYSGPGPGPLFAADFPTHVKTDRCLVAPKDEAKELHVWRVGP